MDFGEPKCRTDVREERFDVYLGSSGFMGSRRMSDDPKLDMREI